MQTPADTATSVVTIGSECSACALIDKLGKLSCCARGGAWFNNCGRTVNSNFEHTWIEGLKACGNVAGLVMGSTESNLVLLNQTSTSHQLGTVQNQGVHPSGDSTHVSSMANSRGYDKLPHLVVHTSLLLVTLNS